MSKFKNSKEYSSFEELKNDYGRLRDNNKKQKNGNEKKSVDPEKLLKQQEKTLGKCRACGSLLTYVQGTNVCACKNENCQGMKRSKKNDDGTETVWHVPVTRILNDKGRSIAEHFFGTEC